MPYPSLSIYLFIYFGAIFVLLIWYHMDSPYRKRYVCYIIGVKGE